MSRNVRGTNNGDRWHKKIQKLLYLKKKTKKPGTAFPSQTHEVAPVFMEGFDLFIFLVSCVAFLALRVFVLCFVPTVACVSVLSILGGPSVVSSVFFSSCYSSRAQSKHCLCSRYGFVLSTNIYSRSIINCYWQQTTNIVYMWKIKTIMYHRYLFYITIKFYYIFGAKKLLNILY